MKKYLLMLLLICLVLTGCSKKDAAKESVTEEANMTEEVPEITEKTHEYLGMTFSYNEARDLKEGDNLVTVTLEEDNVVLMITSMENSDAEDDYLKNTLEMVLELYSMDDRQDQTRTIAGIKAPYVTGSAPSSGETINAVFTAFEHNQVVYLITYLCSESADEADIKVYNEEFEAFLDSIILSEVTIVDAPEEEEEPEEEIEEETEAATSYSAGMHKIGDDMPAGEYLIETSGSSFTYVEVASDSSGELTSIIMNDNFYNRIYVSVADGQYLKFDSGKAIAVEDAAPFEPKDGLYPSGMYRVGVDIPAGEYKISVAANAGMGMGYYAVCSDASGSLGSIITNNNIENDAYQTLQDGQYLVMSDTFIQQ